MKRLKLLCISAVAATTLFSSTVFAAGVQTVQNSLDVDAAIKTAIQNSYKLKSLDIGIQKAKNSYDESLKSAATYDKMIPYIKTDDSKKFSLIKGRDYPQLEYKYAIFQYTNIKGVAENQLKLGVYQLYSGLMNAKEGLDVEQRNFNNVEQQYKKAQLQLSLGLASPIEVKKAESAYSAEKAKLSQIQRQYDAANKQLNQLLGVPMDTKYTSFTKDNLSTQTSTKKYDDYVKDALNNRVEIKNDTENIKLREMELLSVEEVYKYNTQAQNKIARYPIEDAKNKLETDKIDISIEINNLYNDLQTKIKKLEPEKKKYDSAKQTYNKALESYKVGMISKIDFDRAEIGLKAEEIAMKSIQRDIWVAQTKLDYASGVGVDASTLMGEKN